MQADNDCQLDDDRGSDLIPTVTRFLRVVWRRRQVVFNALAVTSVIGLAYYVLAPRQYQSAAKLLIIEPQQDPAGAVADQSGSESTMANHSDLVTSPVVLEGAIQRLAPAHRVDLVDKAPHDWVETLARRLSATTARRKSFIDVTYRSKQPLAAAAVVQAVIDSYLSFVRETHQGTAGELKTVLTDERNKLAASLGEKQVALQDFRRRVGSLALPQDEGVVDPVLQRALHMNDALMAAQQRRLELQASLASLDGAIARGEDINQHLAGIEQTVGEQAMLMTLGMSPQDMSVLAEQEMKLLAAREELQKESPFLGPNHPRIGELQQQIAAIETYLHDYRANLGNRYDSTQNSQHGQLVKNLLTQAVAQAQERERQLTVAFDEARNTAAEHSGQLVELEMLEREVERIEKLHDLLFDRIANVDFRQVQAPIQATVVREPVAPQRASSPQLRFVVLAALLSGLLIGAGIVYVQDVLDDRFDSPEELAAQLAAPVLAIVRDLEPLPDAGLAGVHTHVRPNSPETEAFRTLRTALTLHSAESARLLVSSSEPGDGKTTITVNLAVAFAQAGRRTLVIDADLRKPGLTLRLGLKSSAGVADVMTSPLPVAEAAAALVHHTDAAGLDVLPTGVRRPNPAELLGSERFAELLAWAESQYDQVLVDCPPVLAVSDAQIVGRLVDGGVLVVRPEKNHRRLVVRAVDSFRSTGCPVIGVIANGISTEMGGYGYGYGYGVGYGYGHEENDDAMGESVDDGMNDVAEDAPITVPFVPVADVEEDPAAGDEAAALEREIAMEVSAAATIKPRRAA
jgi:succinoglycan biosynthesis transport protein ExoP